MTDSMKHDFALGVTGFGYADLHDPLRLRTLIDAFDDALAHADPALSARYRGFMRSRAEHVEVQKVLEEGIGYAPGTGSHGH